MPASGLQNSHSSFVSHFLEMEQNVSSGDFYERFLDMQKKQEEEQYDKIIGQHIASQEQLIKDEELEKAWQKKLKIFSDISSFITITMVAAALPMLGPKIFIDSTSLALLSVSGASGLLSGFSSSLVSLFTDNKEKQQQFTQYLNPLLKTVSIATGLAGGIGAAKTIKASNIDWVKRTFSLFGRTNLLGYGVLNLKTSLAEKGKYSTEKEVAKATAFAKKQEHELERKLLNIHVFAKSNFEILSKLLDIFNTFINCLKRKEKIK